MANNATDVLNKARGEIGYSRWNDPETGTKYGRWYAQSHGSDFAANGVPYCGMFVSWVFDQVGATCAGLPGAYTPDMASLGRNAGLEVSEYSAKPGDVLYFDWQLDGVIDHVGIVEYNNGSYLTTIEGNTNNGAVARRTREFGTIVCVIRPPYDGSGGGGYTPGPVPGGDIPPNELTRTGQSYLAKWGYNLGSYGIDGVFGNDSLAACTRYLQYNLNYYGAGLDVDGVFGPKTADAYAMLGNVGYNNTRIYIVKAIQINLMLRQYDIGSYGIDGCCGQDTVNAIRRFQTDHGLAIDGIVGRDTLGALFGRV